MPAVDWGSRIELWVCEDCLTIQESDDYSSFDLHYEGRADQVIAQIEGCWADLKKPGTYLANDTSDEPQRECTDCYRIMAQADCAVVHNEEYDEDEFKCVNCGSLDTKLRDDGFDEFSWSSCDCCGDDRGGSRTRYDLFTKLLETADVQPAQP